MRYTISTNSQATVNYLAAAEDIVTIFENLGFTSENRVDRATLWRLIADAIRNQVQGNVKYFTEEELAYLPAPTLEEILSAEEDLHPTCGCGCCENYESDWDMSDVERNM